MKIGYKISVVALSLAIVAIMVFAPIVFVSAKSVAIQTLVLIGQYKDNSVVNEIMEENDGASLDHIKFELAIADLFSDELSFIQDMLDEAGNEKTEQAMEQLQRFAGPAVTLLISFGLLAISAIITAIFAIFAKDNRKVIFSSMAGIGLAFMVNYSFETISAPFLNGEVTLASLAQSFWVTLLGDIDAFKIDTAFWFIPIIFGVIIVGTVFYNYTLPQKEKTARLELIGEVPVEVEKK